MTTETAQRLIDNLTWKNTKFELCKFEAHDRGVSLFMKLIDVDPRTITKWIEKEGYSVLYFGTPKIDGERVFLVEVRG